MSLKIKLINRIYLKILTILQNRLMEKIKKLCIISFTRHLKSFNQNIFLKRLQSIMTKMNQFKSSKSLRMKDKKRKRKYKIPMKIKYKNNNSYKIIHNHQIKQILTTIICLNRPKKIPLLNKISKMKNILFKKYSKFS